MLESDFKVQVLREIERIFPDCIILKNDPEFMQGIPDTLILFERRWAALEFKRSSRARKQPNQDYYISIMNEMSFAAFIFPENKDDVLHALQSALTP